MKKFIASAVLLVGLVSSARADWEEDLEYLLGLYDAYITARNEFVYHNGLGVTAQTKVGTVKDALASAEKSVAEAEADFDKAVAALAKTGTELRVGQLAYNTYVAGGGKDSEYLKYLSDNILTKLDAYSSAKGDAETKSAASKTCRDACKLARDDLKAAAKDLVDTSEVADEYYDEWIYARNYFEYELWAILSFYEE